MLMLEGGCDIYSLSRMMGHEDIKTTLNVYGHLLKRSDKEPAGGILTSLRAN